MSEIAADKALTVPIAEVRRRVVARVEYAEIQAEICAADDVLAAATERRRAAGDRMNQLWDEEADGIMKTSPGIDQRYEKRGCGDDA
ncbi:hypothetical protein [Mycobacteroides abscessus]|uniref:hypothetical protein n=1 Tax=Mycobacteroides abscessus TaxID=36809 RepID=UPI00092C7773|nr:hypothetical protein [Mycobacteroides abscessus]MBL3752931.1 hypothetical protein [Mycobacteroides abscessus subsp. massiliense]QSN49780.1 hypothetical protein I3U33_26995 [Mycobacteroides abscessus subsp. abscessus]SII83184.1 Uncharacterised protein [Mycobacteroides abscessus subsp. abscessus]SIK57936.1 Uncharacterised protein [Mycobacteroides abscessus subsp. abscessus]SIL83734.1 Uncharacterised protein [Mycobacteroides abscessus subsp. abscessus]